MASTVYSCKNAGRDLNLKIQNYESAVEFLTRLHGRFYFTPSKKQCQSVSKNLFISVSSVSPRLDAESRWVFSVANPDKSGLCGLSVLRKRRA